ncbi:MULTISPECIES: hypothetical protein [unclassified Bradyrhizobium]|uniref:hypothetical protein n=1 Tax=unclassified Bradyrhizobium TaxID=2631580 RepID=UPI002915E699|nr:MULTISPECIES: hypothetical protein [unclassified Bradyrhizobium]
MSVITVMAMYLDEELQARGVFGIGRADCAEILRAVIERTSEVAEKAVAAVPGLPARDPPKA